MEIFRGTTANELWRQSFRILSNHVDHSTPQRSRAGDTIEVLHAAFELEDPRQRWIVSRQPPLNPAFAIAELIWMLAGRNDAAVVNYWNRQLPKYAGTTETYPGAYGYRLRSHFGVDQIRRAFEALAANPDSRQVVLQLWDATRDLPRGDGTPQTCDIPCNLTSILKLRQGRLHWTQVMRSNDIIRGFPYNIIQFTTIQEIMAGWLGVELGPYHHWSDSLHVYQSDLPKFTADWDRAPEPNTESLMVSAHEGEALISELYNRMRRFSDDQLTENEFAQLALAGCPVGYQSLVAILAAEAARRRYWFDLMGDSERRCTNPQLRQLWNLWKQSRAAAVHVGA